MEKLKYLPILLLLFACVKEVKPPVRSPLMAETEPFDAWDKALKFHIDKAGAVNLKSLAQYRRNLYNYVAHLARLSPMTHPERFEYDDEKLMYYINSFNALVLYGLLKEDIKEGYDFFSRGAFFGRRSYLLGGQHFTLAEYFQIIRKSGEERIHFAISTMSRSSPKLDRDRYEDKSINRQLNRAAVRFMNADYGVRYDKGSRTVWLNEVFDTYRKDFVGVRGKDKDLIKFINKYRKNKVPSDAKIEYLDYDWRLRKQ